MNIKNYLNQKTESKNRSSILLTAGSICVVLALLLCVPPAVAQLVERLPNFTNVSGTQITNTNGNWVRIDPAQPNNIDLVETRLFKMPEKGNGIMGIEFKLVGADGGTAWYDSGVYNNFANGGKGGEVNYTLNLPNTNTHSKPFLVTFGKKGESTRYGQGMFCSAGGGGSTGMSWLEPDIDNRHLARRWIPDNSPDRQLNYLIAGAGGGSGGFATAFEAAHGKSATLLVNPSAPLFDYSNVYRTSDWILHLITGQPLFQTVAGGSALDNFSTSHTIICCDDGIKLRQATGIVNTVFNYQTGVIPGRSGLVLQSITQGQGGGKPTVLYEAQKGTPNTNNMGMGGLFYYTVLKPGGRGGSGMAGGGAGSSTTSYYDLLFFTVHNKNLIPTSGAGGTGTANGSSQAQIDLIAGDAGLNDYSPFLDNVSISPRAGTNDPKSGYFMYRTIADTEPPTINISDITMDLNEGSLGPFYGPPATPPTIPLTMATLEPYLGQANGIYDNDGIKSITFSETELSCFMAGQTIPLYITVTDYAGNSTDGLLMVTVKDTYVPVAIPELSPIFDPELPFRIDVSSGSYKLTAANFPKAYDGCKGSNVTIHFPPTTFNCTHAGTQPVTFYYTDTDGNNSPNFSKTFKVVYSPPSRLYVDHTATGANNGLSWADAFTSLQDALHYGCSYSGGSLDILVAKGTYRADVGRDITVNDRNASFTIPTNFKLFGGFPNGGDESANRNPEANPTILSGEIGSGAATDNSYHVVTIAGDNTVLEGFTIRDGYADDNTSTGGGGLILQQVEALINTSFYTTIRNCKFLNNNAALGGAIYTDHQNPYFFNYLNIQNCLFEGNIAADKGGAVYLNNHNGLSNIRQNFVNCVFNNNTAAGNGGALYAVLNAEVNAANCTFGYNQAGNDGGAIYNRGTVKLHNCILYFDTAGGMPNEIGNAGTFHVDYSDIQGSGGSSSWGLAPVEDWGHNIDVDPLFYTSPALSIVPQSPCRNGGRNSYNNEPYEIYGRNVRVSQDIIDMGAFEVNSVVYVAADAPAGGDGNTWATALNNLSDGIQAAGTGAVQRDIWVKEGTYRPDRVAGSAPTPGNRENTFYVNYTLKIYGGFAGNETSIAQRNIGLHPTLLSGDIGVLNDVSDNAYHVVMVAAGDSRLDGLIIEGGNADGEESYNSVGGGITEYPAFGNAHNVVANCVLRNNHAAGNGGAIYVSGRDAVTNFVQCVFYGNTAARGAASFVEMSSNADAYDQNYYHVTAVGNISSVPGAGAFEASEDFSDRPARINFYNSLLAGNTPQNYNDAGNPGHIALTNTYSAATSAGIFVNTDGVAGEDGKIMTADDGLRLASSSPAISYGDTAVAYSGLTTDIMGSPRTVHHLDAGAYESPYGAPLTADANGIIYVRPAASGTGTGSNWANATADLHNAIDAAGVQKVYVAAGNYKVGDHSFIMKNGVAIYGGFDPDNGITDLSHNRIMPSPANTQGSVLDGESIRPVIWNVFTSQAAMDHTAVLDGFTITKGAYSDGAGIRNVYASPTLTNLVIWNNVATASGGGIYNNNSSPLLTNALIAANGVGNANTGVTIYGAGVSNTASSEPVFTNVTITGNILTAPLGTVKGAGIYSNNSSPKVYNSIIWDNRKMGDPTISGADLENEGTVTFILKNSITQGHSTGDPADNNKVNLNPLFAAGYRLTATSPAVDAGDNSLYTGLNAGSKDLAGNPRVTDFASNKPIDMGAYESALTITRWYVSAAQDASPQDGTSWATAFTRFEDGTAAAKAGDTVWVAKGTYTPETAGAYFSMKSGVKIYGGFAATEQALAERDLALGNNAVLQGNGNSVIINTDVDNAALLDGFVVQNGSAATQGGGVLNINTNAQFSDVVFVNNTAADGGAIANVNSQASIHNAVFYANQATQSGGAVHDNASATTVLHATFYNNSAPNGALLAQQDGSSLVMGNSISWGNTPGEWHNTGAASTPAVTYSLLQNANNGMGNVSGMDPKFSYADNPAGFDGLWFTADDGLTATYKSVYVNKGDNALSAATGHDITGAARVQSGIADMGAYESAVPNFCESIASGGSSTLYVNANVPASGDGFSWGGALKTLSEAVEMANYCNSIDSILIAEGTYYPTGYQAAEDRTQSFVIARGNIHLFGGFNNYDPTSRNTGLYKTILSGNIKDDVLTGDNSFHVVTLSNSGNNVTFDGMTISDGTANGTEAPYQYGGGIYNLNVSGVSVSNSVIANNAAVNGGGFYNQSADATFTNVAITGNTATNQGGGFYSGSGYPVFTNVTFANNTASAANSGAMGLAGGAAQLTNTIVYGGTSGTYTAQYSLIEGSTSTANSNISATGMVLADIFSDPDNGDYTLKACSPATNAGTPDVSGLDLPTLDLAGNPRIFADRVDIGAFENILLPDNPGLAKHESDAVRAQAANGTTRYFNSCNELLASVETTGATDNVKGITTARIWIDDMQPLQYVRRHYEITPADHAENATGRLTLYFAQADFDAFNLKNATSQLPNGPTGDVSNLLIEKRDGVSSDGTGAPQTYPGETETISNVEVEWNSNQQRWEVSFNVTGFSGFFVKTTSSPLPVRWISFTARLNEQRQAILDWKADENSVSHYEVERSANARDFVKVAFVSSQGDGIRLYSLTDPAAASGNVYYRVRQVDLDGSYSYSRTVSVSAPDAIQLSAYPNPVRDRVMVEVGAGYVGTKLRLINSAGVLLQQVNVSEPVITLSMQHYRPGIYMLYTFDGKVVKLVRE